MNPNLKGSWIEWEIINGQPVSILVVETDISTAPGADGIDSSAMEDLIDDAKAKHAHPNFSIERIRVVPVGFYGR